MDAIVVHTIMTKGNKRARGRNKKREETDSKRLLVDGWRHNGQNEMQTSVWG